MSFLESVFKGILACMNPNFVIVGAGLTGAI